MLFNLLGRISDFRDKLPSSGGSSGAAQAAAVAGDPLAFFNNPGLSATARALSSPTMGEQPNSQPLDMLTGASFLDRLSVPQNSFNLPEPPPPNEPVTNSPRAAARPVSFMPPVSLPPQQTGQLLPGFRNMDLSGKIRSLPLSQQYMMTVSNLVRQLGPDIDLSVTSAAQPQKGSGGRRTGSTRHDVDEHGVGHTADFVLTRNGKAIRPSQDPQLYARFIELAAPHFPGIGHYDWGIHVGGGSPAFWGPDTTAATANPLFRAAYNKGRQALRIAGGNS